MKVKDFVEMLAKIDQEADIILQKDAEGNGYSPLAGAYTDCVYAPNNTWSGDVYSTLWSAEDACMTEKEWAEIKAKKRCIVLYPKN